MSKVVDKTRLGGTVVVWVTEPQDVMIAQRVAKAVSQAIGQEPTDSFMTQTEVSEKGNGLLAEDSEGGLLVLEPCRHAGRRALDVRAVDFMRSPDRGGLALA